MGICTSVSRTNKTIKAEKMPKVNNDLNLNSSREKKNNHTGNINNNRNNDSLISEKNSNENSDKEENYPDIIITYISNKKTEFEWSFKTKDNISTLFDFLSDKKSK